MSLYDIAYAVGLTLAAPYWLIVPKSRRKVLGALRQRMGKPSGNPRPAGPALMLHAVSVGELNATPALVRRSARPDRTSTLSSASPRTRAPTAPASFSRAISASH